ncbi:DNA topoisomerase 3-alpha [Anastrepha obliqua]|uniref:DNA topoisomerase 3-alpha n=1 Tax=Anastrepha obliqua TaxID=95512 RepID=UPI002409A6B4|nr:DNA topoisomerase 3-alpha [Anastrepha obliqua]
MVRAVFGIVVLMLVVMTFTFASTPPLPWGVPGIKETLTTTQKPDTQDACPEPTEELKACMRKWACQYLIRLDLRCLLNLNGLPLVGNALGGLLGGGGGGQQPALGGSGGGLLGGPGGGLLGGTGGILGSLLG